MSFCRQLWKPAKSILRIGAQSDPVEFMSWLLNTLHADLKTSKKRSSIIHECFQVYYRFLALLFQILLQLLFSSTKYSSNILFTLKGELEVIKEIPGKIMADRKDSGDDQDGNANLTDSGTELTNVMSETSRMPFLMLGLDLPPPPLFQDVMEKNIIPQVRCSLC